MEPRLDIRRSSGKRNCKGELVLYPGLPSQLFFLQVFSTAVKKSCEGRPGYEARGELLYPYHSSKMTYCSPLAAPLTPTSGASTKFQFEYLLKKSTITSIALLPGLPHMSEQSK